MKDLALLFGPDSTSSLGEESAGSSSASQRTILPLPPSLLKRKRTRRPSLSPRAFLVSLLHTRGVVEFPVFFFVFFFNEDSALSDELSNSHVKSIRINVICLFFTKVFIVFFFVESIYRRSLSLFDVSREERIKTWVIFKSILFRWCAENTAKVLLVSLSHEERNLYKSYL